MRGTGLIYAYRKGEGVGLRQKFGKEGRRERGSLETFVDENFPNVYNIHNPNQNMDNGHTYTYILQLNSVNMVFWMNEELY